MKKQNILLIMIIGLMLIGIMGVNAETYKINQDINLVQTCNNCTYCASTVFYPNSTMFLNNVTMIKSGTNYNYLIDSNNITSLGTYTWNYVCGNNNEVATGKLEFDVTPSGSSGSNNLVFIIFIILIIYTISFIGFFGKNEIVSLLGGMFMIGLSIYLINNGIIIYRDWITNYFAYITLAIGAFFSIVSGMSLYEDL